METIRYYREVKASERLPEKDGWYITRETENHDLDGMHYLNSDLVPVHLYTWLEPIEITEAVLVDVLLTHYNVSTPEEMAQAILSKLKNG